MEIHFELNTKRDEFQEYKINFYKLTKHYGMAWPYIIQIDF